VFDRARGARGQRGGERGERRRTRMKSSWRFCNAHGKFFFFFCQRSRF
jgi:hypothetical protein